MSELKPCPFCGNAPHLTTYGECIEVVCRDNNCPSNAINKTAKKAAKNWNTRPIEDALAKENERLLELYKNPQAVYVHLRRFMPMEEIVKLTRMLMSEEQLRKLGNYDALAKERDALQAKNKFLLEQNKEYYAKYQSDYNEMVNLKSENEQIAKERDDYKRKLGKLADAYAIDCSNSGAKIKALESENEALKAENKELIYNYEHVISLGRCVSGATKKDSDEIRELKAKIRKLEWWPDNKPESHAPH